MFKRKKFMALCAATFAGVSALGSFAPIAAFADVAKAGDTVITYEGAPAPDEWGLSVPSTIKLDKDGNAISISSRDNFTMKYGAGQIKIIKEDGSAYPTGKSFTVNARATEFVSTDGARLTLYSLQHGTSEPGDSLGNLDNSWLRSGGSGTLEFDANSRSNWVSFSVKNPDLSNAPNRNFSSTISWTAAEK